jgi:hypothetical protein
MKLLNGFKKSDNALYGLLSANRAFCKDFCRVTSTEKHTEKGSLLYIAPTLHHLVAGSQQKVAKLCNVKQ